MAAEIQVRSTDYIFNSKSIARTSDIYSVDQGHGLLLKAWGLGIDTPDSTGGKVKPDKAQSIIIMSVAIDQQDVVAYNKLRQEKNGYDGLFKVPQDFKPLAETCVMQCGAWNLNRFQNVGVITTPGFYRLVMSSETMVGKVIVSGTNLEGRSLFNIPTDLFFGCIS